jgi:hypothetical protein
MAVKIKRGVTYYSILYPPKDTDYFEKIRKKIFLNNKGLTFNFAKL